MPPNPPDYAGMRQMKVDKLGIDLLTHDPVVILKDLEGKRYLPILIGPFEATAIALALEGTAVPRPLSHDLMRTLLDTLSAKLEQIVIHDIRDSTFFAKLVVRTNGEVQEIDARPSDDRARGKRPRQRRRARRRWPFQEIHRGAAALRLHGLGGVFTPFVLLTASQWTRMKPRRSASTEARAFTR